MKHGMMMKGALYISQLFIFFLDMLYSAFYAWIMRACLWTCMHACLLQIVCLHYHTGQAM